MLKITIQRRRGTGGGRADYSVPKPCEGQILVGVGWGQRERRAPGRRRNSAQLCPRGTQGSFSGWWSVRGSRRMRSWTGSITREPQCFWKAAWKNERSSDYGSTSAGFRFGPCGSLRGLWASTPTCGFAVRVSGRAGTTLSWASRALQLLHGCRCHLLRWTASLDFLVKRHQAELVLGTEQGVKTQNNS